MPNPTDTTTDGIKRWVMKQMREKLKGKRLSEQIKAFAGGEIPYYRFMLEISLDGKTLDFVRNPANREGLEKEVL